MTRKFCVMTEGRSGSTSLMECFERADNIIVPSKNIACEDNELLHPKRLAGYMEKYARLTGKAITDQSALIEAFFELNAAAPFAGFKSMPNRHPDFRELGQREDIQFITLRRRDVPSTCASFMRATDSGTWRRHGEAVQEPWTFERERDAERVRNNVRYIFGAHAMLANMPRAIHLAFEDLCNPDYVPTELDQFFGAPIRIEDPRIPTSASEYVTNWDEFSALVQETWEAAKGAAVKRSQERPAQASAPAPAAASAPAAKRRRRLRTATNGRVFYAWELGQDLGHLLRFLSPALNLRERGHEVHFAVRDLSNAEATLGHHGFPIMQAPIWIANVGNLPKMTISYAEIALRYGFISYPGLKAMVKAWRELFRHVNPGLVLTDHSPSALLAARTLGLKTAPIGSGFFNPPLTRPLPSMRYWQKVAAKRIEEPDTYATNVANRVIADLGGERLESFCDLFRVNENFLCTFEELDHYPGRGRATYWGPTFEVNQGVKLAWPAGEGKRIFAYIKPRYRDFGKMLEALRDSGCRVLAYTPGISQKDFASFNSKRMRLSRDPLRLKETIDGCDLVMCHGGPGTVTVSLLAGVPLLLMPTQHEQIMSARRIFETGSALVAMPVDKRAAKKEAEDAPVGKGEGTNKKASASNEKAAAADTADNDSGINFPALLQQLLTEAKFRDAARAFAKKYAGFDQRNQTRMIATRVEELLRE